jgi:hypothetical protein
MTDEIRMARCMTCRVYVEHTELLYAPDGRMHCAGCPRPPAAPVSFDAHDTDDIGPVGGVALPRGFVATACCVAAAVTLSFLAALASQA